MGESEISVRVDTEVEAYPVLSIYQIGNPKPDEGFLIPAALMADLNAAYETVNAAERTIMRHIAERYPAAKDVQYWVEERSDG